MAIAKEWDVLALGVTAVDDLLYVERFPAPDEKTAVLSSDRQCGGLVATALVAAARLGARCAYAGSLGSDELSQFVESTLVREGIDVRHVVRRADAAPAHSRIVVDLRHHTRNIFSETKGFSGADAGAPAAEVIRAARVLFVDAHGVEGMLRAARIAREAGIPVVADLERDDVPGFEELLGLVDHLILSQDFALRLTGTSTPAAAARALWTDWRAAVVITCGADGCLAVEDKDEAAWRLPGFAVDVVDTTGCGDVFHGAYCGALAREMELAARLRFASAAAALKATQPGGQKGIPSRAAVEEFLAKN